MRLNLNKLLDQDHLTPQQMREIRSMLDFNITGKNKDFTIDYKLKGYRNQKSYAVNLRDPNYKTNAYKHILYYIINLGENLAILVDTPLAKEVRAISRLESSNFQFMEPMTTKSQDLYKLFMRLKNLMSIKKTKPSLWKKLANDLTMSLKIIRNCPKV